MEVILANEIFRGSTFVWAVAKTLFLLGVAIYIVFAFVAVRQIGLMTETVRVSFNPFLKVIALIHLGLAVFVFLLSLLIL